MPLPRTRVVHPDRAGVVAGTLEGTMPQSGNITRPLNVQTAGGGTTTTYPVVDRDVPVRVRPLRPHGDEQAVALQESSTVLWAVVVPALTDVRARDRIVVGARTFDVIGVLAESYEVERRCISVEVS